jgi:hypothetical protein
MDLSLASPLLHAAGFRHGFSTRVVDLSLSAPDYAASLARFAAAAGFDPAALRQASQVHGRAVIDARDVPAEADAIVASDPEVAVGVRVADCVPILVADRRRGHVAAIHSGWRGFEAGVIQNALARLDAPARDLLVAVGPSIGPCCFEVGADVAARIAAAAGADARVIARTSGEKAYVDLRAGVRAVLERSGMPAHSIEDVPGCTRCDEARFFSFRRGGESGRMLAAIAVLR